MNQMQGDSLSNPQYRNTRDCLRQSVAVEGYRGLLRGFSAAMYRAIPVNAGGPTVHKYSYTPLRHKL